VEFSYHASLAVGVSARPIKRIERIWADGKLLRDNDGSLIAQVDIGVYTGAETQLPDPLLQGNESVASTPPFSACGASLAIRIAGRVLTVR